MRLGELGRSTSFRFAVALTAAFLAAYLLAGWVAYRAIGRDLDNRVAQAVELSMERYGDTFRAAGRAGLIAAVEARTRIADAEDEFVWLGTRDGVRVAGHDIPDALSLVTGKVPGALLGSERAAEADERFQVNVRDFADLHLVTGQSFEESDSIEDAVLGAFGTATLLILLLAALSGAGVALRGQKRLDRISATLSQVSLGMMNSRVPLAGSGDDLDRLSMRINDALEQLETTVEGIRQVSIDIAHDLRTPISRLGIRLEELMAETEGQPGIRDRLETATAEVRQISATFDSLLRIAQIEAGARRARFRPVALPEIATALHEAYLPVAEENGQHLELDLAGAAAALVQGDRDLLTQLFANLVENALRHCPAGARIRIGIGSSAREVWMSVADNGPGIPEEERARVTRRFYRLDKARHTPGSGLGLALVKAIAELHGATLQLGDNHPGLSVRVSFEPGMKTTGA